MKPSCVVIALSLVAILALPASGQSTDAFFRASGTNILGPGGVPFLIQGNAPCAWRTPESYMLRLNAVHYRHLGSFSDLTNRVLELLTNSVHAQAFWETYWSNYFTQADVEDLAAEGFNTIRVPVNFRMLSPCGSAGTYEDAGFRVLSNVVEWCRDTGLYVILDLHAAPGGQSADVPADPEQTYWEWVAAVTNWLERGIACLWESNAEYYARTGRTPDFNKDRTIDLWTEIATRFRDEKQILAYELLNEPSLPAGVTTTDLRALLTNITAAIRAVDTNHMILVQGNAYASSFDGLTPAWDANMALVFHKYWRPATKAEIQPYINVSTSNNLPILMGEAGENSNPWFYEFKGLLESNHIGWCWWGWKKVHSIAAALSAPITTNYQYVIENFRDLPVDAARVRQGLMDMADGMKTTNCAFEPGYYASLFDSLFGTTPQPFVDAGWPGVVYGANYDVGNQNIACWDTRYKNEDNVTGTAWNVGWEYRNDGVDIWSNSDTHPTSIRCHVGTTVSNEWLKYTVNVPSGGNFRVAFRVAGPSSGQVRLYDGTNNILGPLKLTNTGSYATWRTRTNSVKTCLASGQHTLKLSFVTGGIDMAWMEAVAYTNLITNPGLSGSGTAPTGWLSWSNDSHDADSGTYRSSANSWAFWWDGGLYQDRTGGFAVGDKLVFGGWALTPGGDKLRNGTKYGIIQVEFYKNTTKLSTASSPTITSNTVADVWTNLEATATVPSTCNKIRLVVRCNDWASGDGRFLVDDVYVR